VEHLTCASLGQDLSLPPNIRLARGKHSSLLGIFVNYDRKKFYIVGAFSHGIDSVAVNNGGILKGGVNVVKTFFLRLVRRGEFGGATTVSITTLGLTILSITRFIVVVLSFAFF
jgi:hypothetical protein